MSHSDLKKRARNQALRRYKELAMCERCGATDHLSRHHPDIIGDPDRIEILCRRCHRQADRDLGLTGGAGQHKKKQKKHPRLIDFIPDISPHLSTLDHRAKELLCVFSGPGVDYRTWSTRHHISAYWAPETAQEQEILSELRARLAQSNKVAVISYCNLKALLMSIFLKRQLEIAFSVVFLQDDHASDNVKKLKHCNGLDDKVTALNFYKRYQARLGDLLDQSWTRINAAR